MVIVAAVVGLLEGGGGGGDSTDGVGSREGEEAPSLAWRPGSCWSCSCLVPFVFSMGDLGWV